MTTAAAPASYESFAALLHERFAVAGPAGQVMLSLERVTAGRAVPGRPQPFTLLFRGPRENPLLQGTYAFSHPRCAIAIFIVPVECAVAGFGYEAVFNP